MVYWRKFPTHSDLRRKICIAHEPTRYTVAPATPTQKLTPQNNIIFARVHLAAHLGGRREGRVTTDDVGWQRVTTGDNGWRQVTTGENGWQWVVTGDDGWQRVTTGDNRWQRTVTDNNGWRRGTPTTYIFFTLFAQQRWVLGCICCPDFNGSSLTFACSCVSLF